MTLKAWIDPSDDAVRTESSGRVTDVLDKSPAGNDVSEPGAGGPQIATIDSKTVLNFLPSGRADSLETPADVDFTGPSLTCVIAYVDDGGIAGTSSEILASIGDLGGDLAIYKDFATTDIDVDGDGWTVAGVGGATSENIDVLVYRFDADRDFAEVIKNGGVSLFSVDATGTPTYAFSLAIGNRDSSLNLNRGYESGQIAEFVLFDGVLTYDEIQRIEGYFARKWRALSILPTGHPFKDTPPDVVVDAELIANFIGSDGATTYTAETGQVATFIGNAELDVSFFQYDGSSLLLDGTGDYVTMPASTDWDFGSGDFTIDGWIRAAVDPDANDMVILSWWDDAANQNGWLIDIFADELRFVYSTDGSLSTDTAASSGLTWEPDQWYHVAVCRQGPSLKIFRDGIEVADYDAATETIFNANTELWFGALNASGPVRLWEGNLDSFRIIKGSALYQSEFGVPYRGFRLPVAADLIANFNGPDAATSYTTEDAGARTCTFVGDAQIDTAQHKFGHSSLLLDGTGDYVTIPNVAAWDLADSDFTVETWVRFNGDPGTAAMVLISNWQESGDNRGWYVRLDNNQIRFGYSTTGINDLNEEQAWNPAGDQWYHVAITRSDDRLYFFVDGVLLGDVAFTATIFASTDALEIGRNNQATQNFLDGRIEGVRIINGTALYTADFDVPVNGQGEPII